jgi:hypothetical protein
MAANELEKQAQRTIVSFLNTVEGVRLEREALKDRRYQPELILHNIENYVGSQTESLAWLNVNGFPTTFQALHLVVQNLGNDPSFLQAVQRLEIPNLSFSFEASLIKAHFLENMFPQSS